MSLFLSWYFHGKKWSYLNTLNGSLTGMVAQCAGCNVYEPWAALVIGIMAGCVYVGISMLMLKVKLDDPLDAVAVHFGGGALGVICVPFFKYGNGILWLGHISEPWYSLGVNLAGLFAIMSWACFWSVLIFGAMKSIDILRVDEQTELMGNDLVKHGEAAYPKDAWLEEQYKKTKDGLPPNMMEVSITSLTQDLSNHNAQFSNGGSINHAYLESV